MLVEKRRHLTVGSKSALQGLRIGLSTELRQISKVTWRAWKKLGKRNEMGDKLDGIVGDENWGKFEEENTDLDIQVNAKQKELQQFLSFGGLFDSIYLAISHRIEVKRLVELAGLAPLSVRSSHQQSL